MKKRGGKTVQHGGGGLRTARYAMWLLFIAGEAGIGGVVLTIALWNDDDVRYETHANFTQADLAAGKIPGFTVRVTKAKGTPVVRIADAPDGRYSGYVYVGTGFRIPRMMVAGLVARLEFRRECSEAHRAPPLWLYVFTPEGWDAISNDPKHPSVHGRRANPGVLWSGVIASGQEDTLEWTKWSSPDLRPFLMRYSGKEVVAALCMAGMHAGGVEWAEFRNPRLEVMDKPVTPRLRTPQYPLKDRRTLWSPEEVARAQSRCESDESARGIRDRLLKRCRPWMDCSDAAALALIPPPSVPRAFNVSIRGCPIHGKKIYRHGTYPWRLKFDQPYRIICPVGGETLPSNDFGAFLDSGFRDTSLLTGKYVDDGWGWTAPDGERYWMVAYACHWHWSRYVIPGVLNLSRAWLLSGKIEYAARCALLLDRIASYYPGMQYESQSRMGFMTGGRYRGKILNHIWETGVLERLAEAYDNVFDALKDGGPLEGRLGKSCREVRANIEANLLEEGIDCVHDGRIRGNFGMHQAALATAAVVRQKCPVGKEVDWMLRGGKTATGEEPIEYAFYNYIHKDGMPFETSPSYCFTWVSNFVRLARILRKAGCDFYSQPRFRAMFDVFIDLVCIGRYTPAIGDAGSITSGRMGWNPVVYREAFAHYRDPRYARVLAEVGALKGPAFTTYTSLFEEGNLLQEAARAVAKAPASPPRSRILDGYGLAILNNSRDTLAVSMYYGVRGGHGHFDRLNISFFGYGSKLTPDLGYPDFMNSYVPGIYTWSKNTVSHNCVVVDRSRQIGNAPGRVLGFLDAPGVRFVDVDAPGTYPQTKTYRRALVLVETGPDAGYLVDVFTVVGGAEHDYSLHGPLGRFRVVGGTLSKPRPGTLAGEDVPYGMIYDDPVLGAPGYKGRYSSYKGSGFQHLEHVRDLTGAPSWWAEWELEEKTGVHFHLRILDQPGQRIMVCDGRVSPVGKHPWVLKYLIARRSGKDLHSRYATILEPYRDVPDVLDVRRKDENDALVLHVERRSGRDIILVQTGERDRRIRTPELETDARMCLVRFASDGALLAVDALGGTYVAVGERRFTVSGRLAGRVAAVDYRKRAVTVHAGDSAGTPAGLKGRRVYLFNPLHRCVYTIADARKENGKIVLALREPDVMIGRARVKVANPGKRYISTFSRFAFPTIYPGCTVLNEAGNVFLRAKGVRNGAVILADAIPAGTFTDADGDGRTDAWLADFGPGDQVLVQPELHLEFRKPVKR